VEEAGSGDAAMRKLIYGIALIITITSSQAADQRELIEEKRLAKEYLDCVMRVTGGDLYFNDIAKVTAACQPIWDRRNAYRISIGLEPLAMV
jgi:hypothetical protein